jgi:hypothetical protein
MDRMMETLIRRLPLGGINLGGVHSHGPVDGYVVKWRSSVASTAVGLDGMAHRGLGNGRMTMNTRREVALSAAVVVSMVGLASLMHGSLF